MFNWHKFVVFLLNHDQHLNIFCELWLCQNLTKSFCDYCTNLRLFFFSFFFFIKDRIWSCFVLPFFPIITWTVILACGLWVIFDLVNVSLCSGCERPAHPIVIWNKNGIQYKFENSSLCTKYKNGLVWQWTLQMSPKCIGFYSRPLFLFGPLKIYF